MLVFKRCLAFLVDYLIVALYATILFVITTSIADTSDLQKNMSPIKAQAIGFFTLTLPVFLYFYLFEKSKLRATIGKLLLKIKVNPLTYNKTVLKRNIIKFLPWEIAHTGIHWVVYYSTTNQVTPIWVYAFLILPQVSVLYYIITIIISKGESSFYDKKARAKIIYS